eukprot:TRINITY_DN13646_c0_g1_i3.p1 TRINITY_DN13646_c0_g1~~TRINITY_DN13646_c0_g1_i3.p1  ORF type:complete len:246 (+),score=30.34 TRINITY_DN13646_c0_g1_i3:98-835(+)
MIRRPPRSTLSSSSAASDVYKRQVERWCNSTGGWEQKLLHRIIARWVHNMRTIVHEATLAKTKARYGQGAPPDMSIHACRMMRRAVGRLQATEIRATVDAYKHNMAVARADDECQARGLRMLKQAVRRLKTVEIRAILGIYKSNVATARADDECQARGSKMLKQAMVRLRGSEVQRVLWLFKQQCALGMLEDARRAAALHRLGARQHRSGVRRVVCAIREQCLEARLVKRRSQAKQTMSSMMRML